MQPTNPQEQLRDLIEPLYRGKFWMQLTGVMLILSGLMTALSIIGLIVAWIPIWGGWVLMQAAGATGRVYESGDYLEMKHAMRKLKTYFTIFGVLILIYLIIAVVGLLFGAIGMGGMMSGMGGM
ncbi:DUF5362 domain-containing protein [Halomonas campisalis]|uniref:DUF5362 domain-containing protein n=1 Tax=Billgrantia campisalis TaxID=74661 RepID=A0ABS9PBG8_9GAMM|nr:DUF5362 family protein [Halomonas campisalis]MCG6659102.1 DUF5362 domain-containing protein [Halomonas campisalis]MDR5863863.1 DUF5362 family protein [Halomonas campisalis]